GPATSSSTGEIASTPDPMSITADHIITTGPTIPLLAANGENARPDLGNNNPGNGGHIVVNVNIGGLTIGSTGQFNHVEANGGDYNDMSTMGGNGGVVELHAAGDITLNDGDGGAPAITTYTGQIPGGGVSPSGGPTTLG